MFGGNWAAKVICFLVRVILIIHQDFWHGHFRLVDLLLKPIYKHLHFPPGDPGRSETSFLIFDFWVGTHDPRCHIATKHRKQEGLVQLIFLLLSRGPEMLEERMRLNFRALTHDNFILIPFFSAHFISSKWCCTMSNAAFCTLSP